MFLFEKIIFGTCRLLQMELDIRTYTPNIVHRRFTTVQEIINIFSKPLNLKLLKKTDVKITF